MVFAGVFEKTRAFNAISFAAMTLVSSGISMYALARLLEPLLGWNVDVAPSISALTLPAYIVLSGLTSATYNEVLQFFPIVLGFAPLVLLKPKDVDGWNGLVKKLDGMEWFGMVMGMIAIGITCADGGFTLPRIADGSCNYTMVIPSLPAHYFPPGLPGLGGGSARLGAPRALAGPAALTFAESWKDY